MKDHVRRLEFHTLFNIWSFNVTKHLISGLDDASN